METTLLSATNSSSCSLSEGRIHALTGAVRFSRLMNKEAPQPEGWRAKTSKEKQGGGVPCWRGSKLQIGGRYELGSRGPEDVGAQPMLGYHSFCCGLNLPRPFWRTFFPFPNSLRSDAKNSSESRWPANYLHRMRQSRITFSHSRRLNLWF